MTETKKPDIVQRLHEWRNSMPALWYGNPAIDDAAAEIERLRNALRAQQAEPGADERAAIEAIARLDETYYHQWVKNPLGYVSGNVPINDIVAVIEWARAAQSGQRAGVAEGWRFYSADFSITAHQPSQPGYVMLIRDEIGYKKWHRMDEAAKEEIPLFVTGRGVTFEKALLHANENAMLAAAPTQHQEGGK